MPTLGRLNSDYSSPTTPTQKSLFLPKTNITSREYSLNRWSEGHKPQPARDQEGESYVQHREECQYEEIGEPTLAPQGREIYHTLEDRGGSADCLLDQPKHYNVLWAKPDELQPVGENDYSTLTFQ